MILISDRCHLYKIRPHSEKPSIPTFQYSSTPYGIRLRPSRWSLTWPSFLPVGLTARREDQDFNARLKPENCIKIRVLNNHNYSFIRSNSYLVSCPLSGVLWLRGDFDILFSPLHFSFDKMAASISSATFNAARTGSSASRIGLPITR